MKQRPPTDKDHLEPTDRLWRPAAEPASRGVVEAVEVGEPLYAAVDDVAFGKVTIDLAPWPRLSKKGHLVFGEELPRLVVDREHAQRVIDGQREAIGQTLRPIRIGDAFRFSRADGNHPEREVAEGFYVEEDITEDARNAAKIALFGAVAPWLSPEEAERLPDKQPVKREEARDIEDQEPSDPGPGAYPSV